MNQHSRVKVIGAVTCQALSIFRTKHICEDARAREMCLVGANLSPWQDTKLWVQVPGPFSEASPSLEARPWEELSSLTGQDLWSEGSI